MTRARLTAGTALLAFGTVAATVWPLRSQHLFSWDSANYAFAVERIDISLHRPHPPGYLGYVFAARALRGITLDANAALVAWNVLALPIAAVLTARLAASAGLGNAAALAAALLLVTSPLVWFYTAVAEIYVSELMWAAAIGYAAHVAAKRRDTAAYWCAAALAAAALFKVTTMVLMLPVAVYAWRRTTTAARVGSALLLAFLLGLMAMMFLWIQPGYVSLVRHQFVSATAASRLVGPDTTGGGIGIGLNRNARDTLTALLAALGVVNAIGLLLWVTTSRERPANLDWRFAALWATPWLLEFFVVHIAKPGYVLPLLPLLFIVLAGSYARRSRRALVMLVAAQVAANIAFVSLLTPARAGVDPIVRYRDKPLLRRLLSDLQVMTLPTLATLSESDAHVDALLAFDRSACGSGQWIAVAGADSIDWRRAMYYLPLAHVIRRLPDGETPSIGQNGDFVDVPPAAISISSDCGLLWIADQPPQLDTTATARTVAGVGWAFPPGAGRVTREAIWWIAR